MTGLSNLLDCGMSNSSKTDWDRVGAMSDEMIDTSDIPPLSESFFEKPARSRPDTVDSII